MNANPETALAVTKRRGDVLRQLHRGQSYLVFVEHPGNDTRMVSLVHQVQDWYEPCGHPKNWTGDPAEDRHSIVAEYLAQTV